jgi:hypothetical protein
MLLLFREVNLFEELLLLLLPDDFNGEIDDVLFIAPSFINKNYEIVFGAHTEVVVERTRSESVVFQPPVCSVWVFRIASNFHTYKTW